MRTYPRKQLFSNLSSLSNLKRRKISSESVYVSFTSLFSYLTSSARATIPAANGAEADVPVCLSVQTLCKSVVT